MAPSGEIYVVIMQVVMTEPHGWNLGLGSFKHIGESEEEVGSKQGGDSHQRANILRHDLQHSPWRELRGFQGSYQRLSRRITLA